MQDSRQGSNITTLVVRNTDICFSEACQQKDCSGEIYNWLIGQLIIFLIGWVNVDHLIGLLIFVSHVIVWVKGVKRPPA